MCQEVVVDDEGRLSQQNIQKAAASPQAPIHPQKQHQPTYTLYQPPHALPDLRTYLDFRILRLNFIDGAEPDAGNNHPSRMRVNLGGQVCRFVGLHIGFLHADIVVNLRTHFDKNSGRLFLNYSVWLIVVASGAIAIQLQLVVVVVVSSLGRSVDIEHSNVLHAYNGEANSAGDAEEDSDGDDGVEEVADAAGKHDVWELWEAREVEVEVGHFVGVGLRFVACCLWDVVLSGGIRKTRRDIKDFTAEWLAEGVGSLHEKRVTIAVVMVLIFLCSPCGPKRTLQHTLDGTNSPTSTRSSSSNIDPPPNPKYAATPSFLPQTSRTCQLVFHQCLEVNIGLGPFVAGSARNTLLYSHLSQTLSDPSAESATIGASWSAISIRQSFNPADESL
ncbi:hypothetical protein BJ508DRAFT_350935 [Ascobolus immersus RN42]|uniref:Uncharacterized protein n=1 Tax=Ascobolus immersus RN42 TaxID=1160509 RepID=A0A3N4IIG6_ASCIM|nr:hypothetical protein BJ508DRAFT_350935 [Ascobolus immersus RN42]